MTETAEAVLDLARIPAKGTRDQVRRAAGEAAGGPVWIWDRGERIGAIVSVRDAEEIRPGP